MTDWDKRYEREENAKEEPHPLVMEFASNLAPGRALDIACGVGRHAIWLAEREWQVTAVDSSPVAIEILRRRANEKGLEIDSRIADLEAREFVIAPDSYDLILNCRYLQRDLFPAIRAGARFGGMVIAIIAMADGDPDVKPMNPAFLLNPGELRAEFEGWDIVFEFEGKPLGDTGRRSMAQLVARRPR